MKITYSLKNRSVILSIFSLFLFYSQLNSQVQQVSFNCTNSVQVWEVPQFVTSITITASGASGGDNQNFSGGLGAVVTGTNIPVNPGDTLNIIVGCEGETTLYAAGGGGGTGVFNITQSSTLIVAGGGAGAMDSDGGSAILSNTSPGNGGSFGKGLSGGGSSSGSSFTFCASSGAGGGAMGAGVNGGTAGLPDCQGFGGGGGIPNGGNGGSTNGGTGANGGYGLGAGGGADFDFTGIGNTFGGFPGGGGGGSTGGNGVAGVNVNSGGTSYLVGIELDIPIPGAQAINEGNGEIILSFEPILPIPTLSQWGIIILGIIIFIIGLVVMRQRRFIFG